MYQAENILLVSISLNKHAIECARFSYLSIVKDLTMDLQAEKLNLLQTIINSDDAGLIMDLKSILSSRKQDWFDELSDDQKNDVLTGLAEADRGEVVPHEEVVKLFSKWV